MISIIVPVYNGEKYLNRCIDSILNQSYKDIQLVLIDDGSTDNTARICDDYAMRDNRVVVHHKCNSGVADTRNIGLNLASGNYIGFVDADDYVEADMYQRLYDAITKYDADICSCGYYEESEDASWKYSHGCRNDLLVLDGPEQIYSELFRHESIIGNGNWNKLFRQTILDDVRFKKYVVGEDVEFQCMAIHEAKRMVCISDVMYHYIHNPGNATSSKFRPQSMDIIAVVDSLLDFIKANHPRVLEQMYAYHLMWYMATVQVMHWSKDTRPYKKEKDQLRGVIINNFEKYKNNRYVYKLDKVFMYAFIYGLFRPVYSMFRIYRKMK